MIQPVERSQVTDASFRRKTAFAAFLALGVVAIAAAAWTLRTLVLVTFLAVLLAVMLRRLGHLLHDATGLPVRWAVPAVAALIVAAVLGAGALLAPTIADQGAQLVQRVPEAAAALQRRIGDYPWLENLWREISSGLSLPDPGDAMSQAGRILAGISSSLGYLGLALAGALFLALEPDLYRRGFVRLVPVRHRSFAETLLDELEATIVSWLGGQLILMGFVGVMAGIGLWAIGVPYALALGILAGLLEFVPYLGPILSATPAILLAFAVSPTMALWALGLFVVVQQVENNVLQPIVQERTVEIPPVLLIVTLFGMGQIFGVAGILVATPLLALVLVVVRRIYVERILEGDGVE